MRGALFYQGLKLLVNELKGLCLFERTLFLQFMFVVNKLKDFRLLMKHSEVCSLVVARTLVSIMIFSVNVVLFHFKFVGLTLILISL